MDLKIILHEGKLPENETLKTFFTQRGEDFVKSFYNQIEWALIQGNYNYFIDILKANKSFYSAETENIEDEKIVEVFLSKLKKEIQSLPKENVFQLYQYNKPYPVFSSLRPLPPDNFHYYHILNLLITVAFLPTHKELEENGYSSFLISRKNDVEWAKERNVIVDTILTLDNDNDNDNDNYKANYFIKHLFKINQKELFFNNYAVEHAKVKEETGIYWGFKDIVPGRNVWNLEQPFIKASFKLAEENSKPLFNRGDCVQFYKKCFKDWQEKIKTEINSKQINKIQKDMIETGTPIFPFRLTPVYNFLNCKNGVETIEKAIAKNKKEFIDNQKQNIELIFFTPLREAFDYKGNEDVFGVNENQKTLENYNKEQSLYYSTLKENFIDYFKSLTEYDFIKGIEPFNHSNIFQTLSNNLYSYYKNQQFEFFGQLIRELHDNFYLKKGLGNEFYKKIHSDYQEYFINKKTIGQKMIYPIILTMAEIVKYTPEEYKEKNKETIETTLRIIIDTFVSYITPRKKNGYYETDHEWHEYYRMITEGRNKKDSNKRFNLATTIFNFPNYFSDNEKLLDFYKTKISELKNISLEEDYYDTVKKNFDKISLYFDMCEGQIEKIRLKKNIQETTDNSIESSSQNENKNKTFRF